MASPTTTSAPCPPTCSSRSADRPKTRTSRCSWRSRSVTLLPTFPDAPITAIIPTSSLSITFHPALHPANAPAEVHHVIRTTPKPLVKESPRPQPLPAAVVPQSEEEAARKGRQPLLAP